MIAALSKYRICFDPSSPNDGDNIGVYVRAGSDGDLITSTLIGAKEALDVNVVNGPDDGVFLEDDVHADQDPGLHMLSVRKDALASNTDADGDYASLLTNIRGALWTAPVGTAADGAVDDESPVKIGFKAVATLTSVDDGDRANGISDLCRRQYVNTGANIEIENFAVAVDDTLGGTQLSATPIDCRRSMIIQNLDNKSVWLGKTGVTALNGIEFPSCTIAQLDIGPNIDIFALGDAAGADVRVMELA